MSRADTISTLRLHLEGYVRPDDSVPYFAKVYAHRPLGLAPFDKLCIFYMTGEAEIPQGRKTFGNAMVGEAWEIKAFWGRRPLEGRRCLGRRSGPKPPGPGPAPAPSTGPGGAARGARVR